MKVGTIQNVRKGMKVGVSLKKDDNIAHTMNVAASTIFMKKHVIWWRRRAIIQKSCF